MNRRWLASLAHDARATTALEFAMVGSVLMILLLGGINLGLMTWTLATLQSVAAQTARCVAIGSSACSNAKQYAVTLATGTLGSAMITTANVKVTSATTCLNASGSFEVVAITASTWSGQIAFPLTARSQTVTACYPH